jgi:hypothetical protein
MQHRERLAVRLGVEEALLRPSDARRLDEVVLVKIAAAMSSLGTTFLELA